MRRAVLSLGLALGTASGASAQNVEQVKAIIAKMHVFMQSCAEQNYVKFDDRVSPADVVANATAAYCWKSGGAAIYEQADQLVGLSREKKAAGAARHIRTARDYALPLVLQNRVSLLRDKR